MTLPKVLPSHQPALADQGWTTITYDKPRDPLRDAADGLFQASQAFFDLPISYKAGFKTRAGTEEGWSRVDGEKEFITLRSIDRTPTELKDAATTFWAQAGGLLNETLGRIAVSLGLPAEALTVYSQPCAELKSQRTMTMLRLFRYEGFEGKESKIVAEGNLSLSWGLLFHGFNVCSAGHKDLGLLSLVIGDTPGLEVFDRNVNGWFEIERSYTEPAASLLVGRQLNLLSNDRYWPGGHLVRSYPSPVQQTPKIPVEAERTYRYSIVFVLRAHSPVPINTDILTSSITGYFHKPMKDITALDLFRELHGSHFNINTNIEDREKQRVRLALKKEKGELPAIETTRVSNQ